MDHDELSEFLESELDYPIDTAAVREAIGEVEVDAPDEEDTVTIDSLLADLGDETYDSADVLYRTITGQLPDEYVGRKFYDDRGPNVEHDESPQDGENVSF